MHVTETDTGLDIAIRWSRPNTAKLISQIAAWAAKLKFARITAQWRNPRRTATRRTFTSEKRASIFRRKAFFSPRAKARRCCKAACSKQSAKAKHIADLFSGCGTFSLPLAARARVHAVERERTMLDALAHAARNTAGLKPVTTEPRDLFKRPLGPVELHVSTPWCSIRRAQARRRRHANSRGRKCARIAYVSCNAASFARDARILVDGGYAWAPITPVDQFLWSSHIELVAAFARRGDAR